MSKYLLIEATPKEVIDAKSHGVSYLCQEPVMVELIKLLYKPKTEIRVVHGWVTTYYIFNNKYYRQDFLSDFYPPSAAFNLLMFIKKNNLKKKTVEEILCLYYLTEDN